VLLGYLVESFKTAFSEDQVNQLLQLCLNTLEAQLQQPSHTLLAGAMKCLDSLLTWFDAFPLIFKPKMIIAKNLKISVIHM
jgi:hypothetical protein